MAVEQQRELQKLVQRQRGRLDVHQHWEESLRVSEDIIKDIQRALRCRVCESAGRRGRVVVAFARGVVVCAVSVRRG